MLQGNKLPSFLITQTLFAMWLISSLADSFSVLFVLLHLELASSSVYFLFCSARLLNFASLTLCVLPASMFYCSPAQRAPAVGNLNWKFARETKTICYSRRTSTGIYATVTSRTKNQRVKDWNKSITAKINVLYARKTFLLKWI